MGNILIFHPNDKNRHMFHLSGISYDSSNHKNEQTYEFFRLLDKNLETVGANIFRKCHLDSVVSIKWFVKKKKFVYRPV